MQQLRGFKGNEDEAILVVRLESPSVFGIEV
jgi:hypothetical protein